MAIDGEISDAMVINFHEKERGESDPVKLTQFNCDPGGSRISGNLIKTGFHQIIVSVISCDGNLCRHFLTQCRINIHICDYYDRCCLKEWISNQRPSDDAKGDWSADSSP